MYCAHLRLFQALSSTVTGSEGIFDPRMMEIGLNSANISYLSAQNSDTKTTDKYQRLEITHFKGPP